VIGLYRRGVDFRDYDTRLSAYVLLVDEEERVLLALWNGGPEPSWTMPGGGVELDETVEDAAARELREETGYDVVLGRVLGIDSHVVPASARVRPSDRPMKAVRVVFEGSVVGGTLRNEVDGTTDEARWICLADVPALPRVGLVDAALAMRG
jgi:8-oxo-dGTP diphosphatase